MPRRRNATNAVVQEITLERPDNPRTGAESLMVCLLPPTGLMLKLCNPDADLARQHSWQPQLVLQLQLQVVWTL